METSCPLAYGWTAAELLTNQLVNCVPDGVERFSHLPPGQLCQASHVCLLWADTVARVQGITAATCTAAHLIVYGLKRVL